MPSEDLHIRRAEENEAAYEYLRDAGRLPRWRIVILFYSALQYVDAWLARKGLHPTTHWERLRLVDQDPELTDVFPEYEELKDRSEDARYGMVEFPPGFPENLAGNEFRVVRVRVRSLLNLP
jgi:hypothetical protein